jgi:hypothetical protein
MPRNDERSAWAKIIGAVGSFYSLCALIVLAIGSAFAATAFHTLNIMPFIALLLSCLLIAGLGLYYFVAVEQSELVFRVRISKASAGSLSPVDGVEVALFKNGKKIKERTTNEQGEVAFRVALTRTDEIYVTIPDCNGITKKAALYSDGQCQIVKAVTL